MRQTPDDRHGYRVRAMIVVLWRAGLRVQEAFAPHQLRHAHALELAHEGVALNIQRQLGHANLGTTSNYLQGIDTGEIIATVHARRGPMMSATAGLRL
jgi:integrase/recombinase XerD